MQSRLILRILHTAAAWLQRCGPVTRLQRLLRLHCAVLYFSTMF